MLPDRASKPVLEKKVYVRGRREGYAMFDGYYERAWLEVRHHGGDNIYVAGYIVEAQPFLDGLDRAHESRVEVVKKPFGREVQVFRLIVPTIKPRRDMEQEYVEPGPGLMLVAERSPWLRRPGWVAMQEARHGILGNSEILHAKALDLRAAVESVR